MAIMETVQTLANSQNSLIQLQDRLSMQSDVMKNETLQAFIFDLRDYADSLRIVTDFVKPTETSAFEVADISTVLTDQNKWLRELITELGELEEENISHEFFDLNEGEIRRLIGSLQGVLELNGLNLQDNLTFQRVFKDQGFKLSTVTISAPKEEKTRIFQRLFGKK